MKIEAFEGREYWTAESTADLSDWNCSLNREFKPGVHVIHATRCAANGMGQEMRIIYCETQILADYATSQQPYIEEEARS